MGGAMRDLRLWGVAIGFAAAISTNSLSAWGFPKCTDTRGVAVKFYAKPSDSGMKNARADYRRECDKRGRCRPVPVVIFNPDHPYLQGRMYQFTLLHECGHHAHGDTLKSKGDPGFKVTLVRESKADCYAARRGKAEGRLTCDDIQTVSETFANVGRLDSAKRAVLLKQCMRRIGCY